MSEPDDVQKLETEKVERLSEASLENLDKSELISIVLSLYERLDLNEDASMQAEKELEEKYKLQLADATKREAVLLKTLTEKERETNDLASQIEDLKQYQLPSSSQLRNMLLDPTVNVVINRLKKELDSTKQRLEETQSELSAWKFTQDSQTGKQLMARCRTLFKENEDLGKQISQGRIAKLEGEIALEKKLVEEMKVAQTETEQFVMELDEDTEGLQAVVYLLQQQLKEANDKLAKYEGNMDSMETVEQEDYTQQNSVNGNDTDSQETHEDAASNTSSQDHYESNGVLDERTKNSNENLDSSENQVPSKMDVKNIAVTSVTNGHNNEAIATN